MKIIREHIVVKVPSIFIETSGRTGLDGKEIVLNPYFNPERHVRNYGIVESVPDELLKTPIMADTTSRPAYHDNPKVEFKTAEHIKLEVEVGDKVYFHYNCLLPDTMGEGWNHLYMYSRKEESGEVFHYFRVKYELVFAAIRMTPANGATKPWSWSKEKDLKPTVEGLAYYTDNLEMDQVYRKRVIMIGSYVLIEPDLETWEDISIPTPETLNGRIMLGQDGRPVMKPKDKWIVTKSMPHERYLRGWVRYCGSALHGDREFLRPGNYVYFQKFADTKMNFEGYTFFRMRQRHIFAIDQTKQIDYASI